MKLAVSELAWPDSISNLELLSELGINYIEAVIPKHVDWESIDLTEFKYFIDNLKLYNIDVKSTQSITYNCNLNSFANENFTQHLRKVLDICYQTDINTIVLGAPKLRNQYNNQQLSLIFKQIDSILKHNNQILLLEPNSKIYNGEYFFTVDEIVNFIDMNNFTNIKTMIDTHNIILEGQDPSEIFLKYQSHIKHIHVSENELSNLKDSIQHNKLSQVLHDHNYDGLIVYECIKTATLLGDIKLFSYIYNK